jgi:hypothetical protein
VEYAAIVQWVVDQNPKSGALLSRIAQSQRAICSTIYLSALRNVLRRKIEMGIPRPLSCDIKIHDVAINFTPSTRSSRQPAVPNKGYIYIGYEVMTTSDETSHSTFS